MIARPPSHDNLESEREKRSVKEMRLVEYQGRISRGYNMSTRWVYRGRLVGASFSFRPYSVSTSLLDWSWWVQIYMDEKSGRGRIKTRKGSKGDWKDDSKSDQHEVKGYYNNDNDTAF